MLVARDLHVDDLVLDLPNDRLLVRLQVYLLQRDHLAREGQVHRLVKTQKDLPEGALAELEGFAEVGLLVFFYLFQLQLPA